MIHACGVTDRGCVRGSNEDCFAVEEELQLLAVADGLGGHKAGEIAARLAVDGLVEFVRERRAYSSRPRPSGGWPFGFDHSLSDTGNAVRTGMCLANVQVLETSMTSAECSGMGTTLVAALVEGNRVSVGHVGDSRAYLLGSEGLRLLTTDDSWIATMLDQDPPPDPDSMWRHPMRNALTNVMGAGPRTRVRVVEETLSGGELLLLSTDGVHGVLDTASLERLLTRTDDLREMATGVISAAMKHGSRDNCTAVVARYC